MAGRKQSILKRDARGDVIYDTKGRALVEKVVRARTSAFAGTRRSKSGPVRVRTLHDEERQRYGS